MPAAPSKSTTENPPAKPTDRPAQGQQAPPNVKPSKGPAAVRGRKSGTTSSSGHARSADELEMEEMRRELSAVRAENARLRARPVQPPKEPEDRRVFVKPHGEANRTVQGFDLAAAMGLDNNPALYNAFRAACRNAAQECQLAYTTHWRNQDALKLGTAIRMVEDEIHYLTENHFPFSWPAKEAIKLYLRGKRKPRRKGRSGKVGKGKERQVVDENSDDAQDKTRGVKGVPLGSETEVEDIVKGSDDDGSSHQRSTRTLQKRTAPHDRDVSDAASRSPPRKRMKQQVANASSRAQAPLSPSISGSDCGCHDSEDPPATGRRHTRSKP